MRAFLASELYAKTFTVVEQTGDRVQVDWDRHRHCYIARAWYRRPNGGGTPTRPTSTPTHQQTNRPGGPRDGIREGISTCPNQTSSHHPTITSLQHNNHIRFFNPFYQTNPINQNGLLQDSPHRLRGRCCLRLPPGRL
jgi:hypothetical protein